MSAIEGKQDLTETTDRGSAPGDASREMKKIRLRKSEVFPSPTDLQNAILQGVVFEKNIKKEMHFSSEKHEKIVRVKKQNVLVVHRAN